MQQCWVIIQFSYLTFSFDKIIILRRVFVILSKRKNLAVESTALPREARH